MTGLTSWVNPLGNDMKKNDTKKKTTTIMQDKWTRIEKRVKMEILRDLELLVVLPCIVNSSLVHRLAFIRLRFFS